MPDRRKPAPKARTPFHWQPFAIPAAVIVILIIASFTFAANMEEKDTFCASCHTQPESTFFSRETGAATDLASFHTTKNVKCIDCHSGAGTGGRVVAMMMGARNALAWFTHTATQPAPLTFPIGDTNCVKCHAQTLNQTDFNNHFHAFLPRWRAADVTAATCVECHGSHNTDGEAQIAFLNRTKVQDQCQRCHNVLGGGE